MKDINELFWNASGEELKQGYIYQKEKEEYICLICGTTFSQGIIYQEENVLMEASRAIRNHIAKEHTSVFDYLVNMNKIHTGLTTHQKELLEYFQRGLSDKEIIVEMGGGSTSTIRNHRFKLKEKERQAKIFTAIMGLIEEQHKEKDNSIKLLQQNKDQKQKELISIHKGATMVDERYAISNEEMEQVIKTYFIMAEGKHKLKNFPSKEKRKIIVLKHILGNFQNNKKYTEKEVNEVLSNIFEDFVTLRRYMIEYGFMDRTKDCSEYWLIN